jgi:hypothetical protein
MKYHKGRRRPSTIALALDPISNRFDFYVFIRASQNFGAFGPDTLRRRLVSVTALCLVCIIESANDTTIWEGPVSIVVPKYYVLAE